MNDEINTNAAAESGSDQSASLQSVISSLLGNPEVMSMLSSLTKPAAAQHRDDAQAETRAGARVDEPDAEPVSRNEPNIDFLSNILNNTGINNTNGNGASESGRPGLNLGDISGLGKMLSNPELLGKMPAMINAIMPLLGGRGNDAGDSQRSVPAGAGGHPELSQAAGSGGADPLGFLKKRGKCCDKHIKLLHALKPYLNRERQEVVETIIKVNKITEVFQTKA